MGTALAYECDAARHQLYSRGSVRDKKSLTDAGDGQGQERGTRVQLAAMFSAVANNVDMPTPRITDGLYVTDGVEYNAFGKANTPYGWRTQFRQMQ